MAATSSSLGRLALSASLPEALALVGHEGTPSHPRSTSRPCVLWKGSAQGEWGVGTLSLHLQLAPCAAQFVSHDPFQKEMATKGCSCLTCP